MRQLKALAGRRPGRSGLAALAIAVLLTLCASVVAVAAPLSPSSGTRTHRPSASGSTAQAGALDVVPTQTGYPGVPSLSGDGLTTVPADSSANSTGSGTSGNSVATVLAPVSHPQDDTLGSTVRQHEGGETDVVPDPESLVPPADVTDGDTGGDANAVDPTRTGTQAGSSPAPSDPVAKSPDSPRSTRPATPTPTLSTQPVTQAPTTAPTVQPTPTRTPTPTPTVTVAPRPTLKPTPTPSPVKVTPKPTVPPVKATPKPTPTPTVKPTVPPVSLPGSTPPRGMDVSGHQGNVDWTSAYRNGGRFVYVKATEATRYLNPYFNQQYNGAATHGLVRGAYHFALPDRSSGAVQANYFVNHGGGWSPDTVTLPPMLDIEYNPYGSTCYGMSARSMSAWIADFDNTVHARTGRWPTIYTTTDWWRTCTGNNPNFGNSALFLARYARTPGTMPAGWRYQTIWQYDDRGVLPGDQDVFNGSYANLRRFAAS